MGRRDAQPWGNQNSYDFKLQHDTRSAVTPQAISRTPSPAAVSTNISSPDPKQPPTPMRVRVRLIPKTPTSRRLFK